MMHNAPETIAAKHHPKHPKQCTENAPKKVKAACHFLTFLPLFRFFHQSLKAAENLDFCLIFVITDYFFSPTLLTCSLNLLFSNHQQRAIMPITERTKTMTNIILKIEKQSITLFCNVVNYLSHLLEISQFGKWEAVFLPDQ